MNRDSYNIKDAEEGKRTIITLIIINVVMFFFISNPELKGNLALSMEGIRAGRYYEVLTAAFLHGNFSHLFFNMYGLYLFGGFIAPILGRNRFIALYLISAVVGNLLWVIFNFDSHSYVVGASGALFGVMLGAAMLMPQVRLMLIFFPQPIKITTLIIIYAIIEIISQFSGARTGIAHLAHLGGFVGGYLYLVCFASRYIQWNPLNKIISRQNSPKFDKPKKPQWHKMPEYDPKKDNSSRVPKSEKERLQNKLATTGINSFTQEEIETLKRIRQQMQDN